MGCPRSDRWGKEVGRRACCGDTVVIVRSPGVPLGLFGKEHVTGASGWMSPMADTLDLVRWPCPVCGTEEAIVVMRSVIDGQVPYLCMTCGWAYTQIEEGQHFPAAECWPS